ncbi:MAG: hypothetical protein WCW02_00245 [Candidatus Buchananbacteria bacterium]
MKSSNYCFQLGCPNSSTGSNGIEMSSRYFGKPNLEARQSSLTELIPTRGELGESAAKITYHFKNQEDRERFMKEFQDKHNRLLAFYQAFILGTPVEQLGHAINCLVAVEISFPFCSDLCAQEFFKELDLKQQFSRVYTLHQNWIDRIGKKNNPDRRGDFVG